MATVFVTASFLFPRVAELSKPAERVVKKPPEPDAFAFAILTDPVHSIVPVARSHQGQSVRPRSKASIKRAHAMFIEACRFRRHHRKQVSFGLVFGKLGRFKKRYCLV